MQKPSLPGRNIDDMIYEDIIIIWAYVIWKTQHAGWELPPDTLHYGIINDASLVIRDFHSLESEAEKISKGIQKEGKGTE